MFLTVYMLSEETAFVILMPESYLVLVSRFCCSIMMHLSTDGKVRDGIFMMKYVTKHPEKFTAPGVAFSVGLMKFLGAFASEIMCIVFLCSLTDCIEVVIRFLAFGSIASVDTFYSEMMPDFKANKIKKPAGPYKVLNTERTLDRRDHPCCIRGAQILYKVIRIVYCSYIFYFMPFTAIWLPYLFV